MSETIENHRVWENGICRQHPAGFECTECDDMADSTYYANVIGNYFDTLNR